MLFAAFFPTKYIPLYHKRRYKALGLTEQGKKWKLFFKVFCYLEPERVPDETVESGFLYEQVIQLFLVFLKTGAH